jgi:hypothetical protein
MNQEALERRLGTATIEPAGPVVAGSVGEWTITLTVGSLGIDEGGTIKIAQRFASDWEPAQFDKPAHSGYTTVKLNATDPSAKVRPRWDRKGHDRPWMNCIVLDVYDGSLSPSDTVTVRIGDRSGASRGSRAQSFQETKHEFRVLVDPTNACRPRPIAKSPVVKVIAGETVELACIAPSQMAEGESRAFVKGQDQWGNPTPAPADVKIEMEKSGEGTVYFIAKSGRLSCRSNPVTIYKKGDEPKYKKYWGDLHAQSDATVGTGTEEEYFTFARDVAKLDFCSHQGNDFQVRDEDWKKLNDVVRAFHKDGEFVAFPGWEWSGNSTVGGDRNVWYLEEGMPIFRSSHWQVTEPENSETPADTVPELFERVRKLPREKVLLGSHVGGRFADIRLHFDQELGPLVELVSCWGVFEWMLWDAFDKRYIVGVMCNSDGHKGRPGAEGPGAGQFGIANGLTCVLAETKTRAAIFKALKERRCYGTTGARIDLDFQIDGHLMGSVISVASGKVVASAKGTGPLEKVELYEGKRVIKTGWGEGFICVPSTSHGLEARGTGKVAGDTGFQPVQEKSDRGLMESKRIRISWRGSRIRGRGRRVNWDGTIRVEGAKIISASANFDTPVDRIVSQNEGEVTFISQTTGDTDSIDLVLDRADRGKVTFDSKAGRFEIELAELTAQSPRKVFEFGGLGIQAAVERYPENPVDTVGRLEAVVDAPKGKTTPYFVKVTQCDGQMAWSSPIYLRA